MDYLEGKHSKPIENLAKQFCENESVDKEERSVCHLNSQDLLHKALTKDNCMIVQGTRGSGKSRTVICRTTVVKQHPDRRVIIVSSDAFYSDQSVIDALEAAIGYNPKQVDMFFQALRIARQ